MVRSINRAGTVLILLMLTFALVSCGGGGGDGGGGSVMPGVPSGLLVAVSSNSVLLSWDAAANAASYRVYRATSPGLTTSTGTLRGATTNTSYNDGATNGATYYYIVSALNSYGESAASAEIAVTLGSPVISSTVTAVAGDGSVGLSWTGSPNAASYSVYRSTTSGTAYAPAAASLLVTTFTDTAVTNGTTYYYVVTGTSAFGEGPPSSEVSATPNAPTGTITVQGAIRYEDKAYDQLIGQTGATTFKPVRFAEVQMIDAGSSATLWTTMTDSSGIYSISTTTNTGKTVYVRVLSSSAPISANRVNVKNLSSATFAVKTASITLSGNVTINLSIPVSNHADGAFNILDVFVSGFEFVNTYAGQSPPTLNAFWELGSQYGTYFCPFYDATWCRGGEGIYILGDPFDYMDTDEFDDDVLWHEFGHFALDKFSYDDSPGGSHYLNDNTQDLRLSWSEGWGNFFQGATKYWIDSVDPGRLSDTLDATDTYVDTEVGGVYISISIENPDASPFCSGDDCKYSSNEIAVANVLWQLMKEPTLGMTELWPSVDAIAFADRPVSIETFWDKWLFVNAADIPTDLATLNTIYSTRSIIYQQDVFEGDDSLATAGTYTAGVPQTHTIYGDGDLDWVKFVPSTTALHTFSTGTLRNGADTYLTLYDSGGNPLMTNDNYYAFPATTPNIEWALSSRIQYSVTSGQTYYLSVQSSTSRPSSAGKYGSYTLTISP